MCVCVKSDSRGQSAPFSSSCSSTQETCECQDGAIGPEAPPSSGEKHTGRCSKKCTSTKLRIRTQVLIWTQEAGRRSDWYVWTLTLLADSTVLHDPLCVRFTAPSSCPHSITQTHTHASVYSLPRHVLPIGEIACNPSLSLIHIPISSFPLSRLERVITEPINEAQ